MLEKASREGYSQMPFESTYQNEAKALVCESTSDISVKINNSLKNMNYSVSESSTYSEAIRNLRYNE